MKVLFIGLGKSAQCYYRCALPAMAIGADWIGVAGQPPKVHYQTGIVNGGTQYARIEDYDVIVLQTPRAGWRHVIRELQGRGKKVLVEVDDYLRAIRKLEHHDFRAAFDRSTVEQMELNMRLADGMIVATQFLADKYRTLNPKIWVCENGLDLGRYQLTRPWRQSVTIGWAGATGHKTAFLGWLAGIEAVMQRHPDTSLMTIGQPFAHLARTDLHFRCISLPFIPLEVYPAAMCSFGVAIAPAGTGLFYRGKSDLRFLEAGALGLPIVADPVVYHTIEDGVTGLHARTAEDAEEALEQLLGDPDLRTSLGDAAREWVHEHRGIRSVAHQWEEALAGV